MNISRLSFFAFLFPLLVSSQAYARYWQVLKIPGAYCGDGSEYQVFFSRGDAKKISMEFMGGGTCWDYESCWDVSLNLRTWIHHIPTIPSYSYLTSKESPIDDYTQLYLPYCSGDVWIGNHQAHYVSDKGQVRLTYHEGKNNFERTMNFLEENQIINFIDAEKFVMYGSSAGAIGSLFYIETLNKYLTKETKKLLIADSPGLHWDQDFWKKFTPKLINEMKNAMNDIGLDFDPTDALIAKDLAGYCQRYSNWEMGFIQSTKDVIMSKVFAGMSSSKHQKMVLGDYGIKKTLKDMPNCHLNIPDTKGHAFLLSTRYSRLTKDMDTQESVKDFTDRMIKEFL